MIEKDKISSDQWQLMLNTTIAASAFVASASGGGLEMFKELISAGRFMLDSINKSSGSGYGELVDAFLEKMKDMSSPKDAQANAGKFGSEDLTSLRVEARLLVAEGAAFVSNLSGSDGFKRWVLDMARKVAETKTGGVLGFGASSIIDEKERAALDELADIMGY